MADNPTGANPDATEPKVVMVEHYDNLAKHIDPEVREELARNLFSLVKRDVTDDDREEHIQIVEDGKERTMQREYHAVYSDKDKKPDNDPEAPEYAHPSVDKALLNIIGRLKSDTFTDNGVVSYKIRGTATSEERARAERMKTLLNQYYDDVQIEYRNETEDLMQQYAIWGVAYKKISWGEGRPTMMTLPMKDVILETGAPDVLRASRITHKIVQDRMWFNERRDDGMYDFEDGDLAGEKDSETALETNDKDEGTAKDPAEGTAFTADDQICAYEIHTHIYLPALKGEVDVGDDNEDTRYRSKQGDLMADIPEMKGRKWRMVDDMPKGADKKSTKSVKYGGQMLYADGKLMPYIITISGDGKSLLSVVRNWREGDPRFKRKEMFVDYKFIPSDDAYPLGLIHLIASPTNAATALVRATMSITQHKAMPGGFVDKAVMMSSGEKQLDATPGVFQYLDATVPPGGSLEKLFYPLPTGVESPVTMSVLEFINREIGDLIGFVGEDIISGNQEMPVGSMAIAMENRLRPINSISASFRRSFMREIHLIGGLFAEFMGDQPYPDSQDGNIKIGQDFQNMNGIYLLSDPSGITQEQKILKARDMKELQKEFPHLIGDRYVAEQYVIALGKDPAEAIKPDALETPVNLLTENENLMSGQGAKAFLHQDHKAHLEGHKALLNSPELQAFIESDPQGRGKQVRVAIQDHIADHIGKDFVAGAIRVMGIEVPPLDKVPPEMETKIAAALGKASSLYASQEQEKATAEKNIEDAKDPVMEQKKRDDKTKRLKIMLDKDTADDKNTIEAAKVIVAAHTAGVKVDADMLSKAADIVERNDEARMKKETEDKKARKQGNANTG